MIELATGKEIAVTSGSKDQYTPAIYDNRVVFSDLNGIYLATIEPQPNKEKPSGLGGFIRCIASSRRVVFQRRMRYKVLSATTLPANTHL